MEQKSNKFDEFMKLIQAKAHQMENHFFINSGEGHEFETESMEGEDLFGWLIPKERIDEFIEDERSDTFDKHKWESYEVFAEWYKGKNGIEIAFNIY